MNWKRGFFRVWIFISILYVLSASLIFGNDIYRNFRETFLIDSESCHNLKGDSGLSFIDLYPGGFEYAPSLPDGFKLDGKKEFIDCLEKERPKANAFRLKRILDLTMLIFLPPLGLLAFIGSISWTARGFKK